MYTSLVNSELNADFRLKSLFDYHASHVELLKSTPSTKGRKPNDENNIYLNLQGDLEKDGQSYYCNNDNKKQVYMHAGV